MQNENRIELKPTYQTELKGTIKMLQNAKDELASIALGRNELREREKIAIKRLMELQDKYVARIKDMTVLHEIDTAAARWNFDSETMSFVKTAVPVAKSGEI